MAQHIRDTITNMFKQFAGQGGTLVIPRPYISLCGGDHLAALLLSQILYWSDRTDNKNGWFSKSYEEWHEELGMTEYQIKRAIRGDKRRKNQDGFAGLASIGVEMQLKPSKHHQGAPTLHYRVDQEKLTDAVVNNVQNAVPNNVQNEDLNIVQNLVPNNVQDQYTENTETTAEREIAPPQPPKDYDPRPPSVAREMGELPKNMRLFLNNNAGDMYQQGLNKATELRVHPVWQAYAAGWADPKAADPTPLDALNDWNIVQSMQAAVDAGKYTLEDITAATKWKWSTWKATKGGMRIQYIASDIGSYLNLRTRQQQKVTPITQAIKPDAPKGFGIDQFVRDVDTEAETDVA